MENTKMTKREVFEKAIALLPTTETEVIEGLKHEIELLNKKRSVVSKRTKANDSLRETLFGILKEQGTSLSINEIQKAMLEVVNEDLSNQKISSLLKPLVDSKEVVKSKDTAKKVCVYGIVVKESE